MTNLKDPAPAERRYVPSGRSHVAGAGAGLAASSAALPPPWSSTELPAETATHDFVNAANTARRQPHHPATPPQ